MYAEVAFPIALKKVFSYQVPESLASLVKPGMRCTASFGRRQTVGVVTGLTEKAPAGFRGPVKALDGLLDAEPSLGPDLLELGRWMADYYYCSLGESLFAALPTGLRKTSKAFLALTPGVENWEQKVEAVLQKVGSLRGVNLASLSQGRVPFTARTRTLAEALRQEGLLSIKQGETEGRKARSHSGPLEKGPALNPGQQKALWAVEAALNAGAFRTFLLQGITGSGKTEVYLRAIARVLEQGKQAVVLIPEIALTPQTEERFRRRFGNQVAVLHSRLSAGERAGEWRRIANGEASVVVGARSALFAPTKRLGLIVVDEEHEASYKQEDAPRYQARDAAVKRAQLTGAVALLGSATPSLESIHNTKMGKYELLTLAERAAGRGLPSVRVVDLREEWLSRDGDRPILTVALAGALKQNLERGEQAMLFLNRRGLHSLTLCLQCGEPVHCPHCSVPVTLHRGKKGPELLCHYCNWQGPVPEKCAKCGGMVKQVGLGTEKVEEEVKNLFPKARVARMDLDTTRRQGSHGAILGRFARGEVDILIGTQMIAKGHDFPGVTLVGVVGADVGLSLPDFRASERTFQLLTQVSGRAGRGDREGVVYLQTFQAHNPALVAASGGNMEDFWKNELELREALGYPPFNRLGLLIYRSKYEKKALATAEKAAEFLRKRAVGSGVEVMGPAPAGIFKLRGHYRFQILMKSKKPQALRQLLYALDEPQDIPSGVVRSVDLDPQSML